MSNFWQDLGLKTKIFLQLALAIFTIVFVYYFIPKVNNFEYSYEQGKPWQYEDLYSPYDFAIIKQGDLFNQEKEEIVKSLKQHFVVQDLKKESLSRFTKLFSSRVQQLDSLDFLRTKNQALAEKGKQILDKIYLKGIIVAEENQSIMLVENNVAKNKNASDFYSLTTAKEQIASEEFNNEEEKNFLVPLLKMSLIENIVFDEALNNSLRNRTLSEISTTKGMVKKDEKIISKGEIVDLLNLQKLKSFEKKYSEQILGKSQSNYMSIGYFLLIGILISILVLYLYLYQRGIFSHFRQFSLIFLLINVFVFITAVGLKFDPLVLYVLPFSIVPIVLRAFFKRETALYVHLTIIFLAALFVPKAFAFVFIQFTAGITAIYGNKDVKYWSQFFKAIAFIFLAYVVSYLGLSLAESGTLESVKLPIIGLLALNVFLSFLAYPLIVFFEKMFGLITDISLVEYTDINKPLLKRLSLEARGTFQHSHQVSNLAEAAASEIGANSLLVKVGALYHDIGKMEQSIYFIENQFPDENPHSKLSYEESAKIIIAHVTDGVKLAKKYGMPQQIIEFIQTHHGTTRVEYFYRMHAKVHKDEQINDQTFKYPGPAPFRKEHAILMMADSVEAASKSLKNPTHESLCELVDNIIDYQRSRGQFDNVPITFKEITQCKEVFKKMLASIYHIRIEYPK
jgi:putative nucleotidyltransferase with HDIG domain